MDERLQKYMARCGVASRRKCEEYILSGKVKVNGIIINELGSKVNESIDKVEYDGSVIVPEEKKVYIMLNKPEGYITSVKDEKNRQTVLDLINTNERIYPIGRLDYDSSGLLLLTNDGEIYNKIIHPRVKIVKEYVATVNGELKKTDLEKLQKGIDIGGYITAPAKVELQKSGNGRSTIVLGIHEGKNRQIRRMCSSLNHEVISLKRIAIGKITLGDLRKGEYRNLTMEELDFINNL